MFIWYIMNSVKYNNNPDAKNYSNCDISGSFYAVGPIAPAAAAVGAVGAAGATCAVNSGPTGPVAKCECIGTCSKKNS